MPQLGQEVGEADDDERHARVVVVLEGRPVDARPGQPLPGKADAEESKGKAAALERLPGDEGHRRDAQPPDHQVAGVVDRGCRIPGEAPLIEPDGLEIERPGPPW